MITDGKDEPTAWQVARGLTCKIPECEELAIPEENVEPFAVHDRIGIAWALEWNCAGGHRFHQIPVEVKTYEGQRAEGIT